MHSGVHVWWTFFGHDYFLSLISFETALNQSLYQSNWRAEMLTRSLASSSDLKCLVTHKVKQIWYSSLLAECILSITYIHSFNRIMVLEMGYRQLCATHENRPEVFAWQYEIESSNYMWKLVKWHECQYIRNAIECAVKRILDNQSILFGNATTFPYTGTMCTRQSNLLCTHFELAVCSVVLSIWLHRFPKNVAPYDFKCNTFRAFLMAPVKRKSALHRDSNW